VNKELELKNNEELCTLVLRMKLQLLESRFMRANGTLEKSHTIVEIRKTIARILTILKKRNIECSIGTHGITMYDRANNTVKSINQEASAVINNVEKEMGDETSKSPIANATQKDAIVIQKKKVVQKQVKKQDTLTKTPVIRKSSGGGA
jgi:large subunit ribosomal protein L29